MSGPAGHEQGLHEGDGVHAGQRRVREPQAGAQRPRRLARRGSPGCGAPRAAPAALCALRAAVGGGRAGAERWRGGVEPGGFGEPLQADHEQGGGGDGAALRCSAVRTRQGARVGRSFAAAQRKARGARGAHT